METETIVPASLLAVWAWCIVYVHACGHACTGTVQMRASMRAGAAACVLVLGLYITTLLSPFALAGWWTFGVLVWVIGHLLISFAYFQLISGLVWATRCFGAGRRERGEAEVAAGIAAEMIERNRATRDWELFLRYQFRDSRIERIRVACALTDKSRDKFLHLKGDRLNELREHLRALEELGERPGPPPAEDKPAAPTP